ncbi:MAG: hypothetical protein EXR77_11950 [Myxococcales bacterium]|nr:hypothetical protein [Myxococcales bacterium]
MKLQRILATLLFSTILGCVGGGASGSGGSSTGTGTADGQAAGDTGATPSDAAGMDAATAGDAATLADTAAPADTAMTAADTAADLSQPPADTAISRKDTATATDTLKPPADTATPPPDVAVASGACTNAADSAILAKPDIDKVIENCALKSFGNAEGAKKCIAADAGLSTGCAGCFGTMLSCTFSKCIGSCMGGNTPECKKCNDKECIPGFEKCSGVSQN